MARRSLLLLLLFILFIMEGSIVPFFVPADWQTRIFPHLAYVVILFIAVYDHRHSALVVGIVFGLLHDIVYYGSLIGPYSFAMGLTSYLLGRSVWSKRASLPLMMLIIVVGSLLLDSIIFGTYRLFELHHMSYDWALTNHIIPNTIVQFIFALIIYVPIRRQLEKLRRRPSPEEKKV